MQFIELENEKVYLKFLARDDFEKLYSVASEAKIWEQHPDSNRYTLEGFTTYFHKLSNTDCPFLIIDKNSDKVIGATSFYEFDEEQKSVAIGYTFLKTSHWGGFYNQSVKQLMMDYAFKSVDKIIFHVRDKNFRSQSALTKIGAKLEKSYPSGYDNSMQLVFAIYKSEHNS